MEYNNENEITGKKQEIAQQCITATAKLQEVACGVMQEAGEKISLLAGCSIPSLTRLTMVFCDHNHLDSPHTPTADDITLGACYVIATVEDHGEGVVMGFSPETLDKALVIFNTLMGREYPNIAPVLRQMIDRQKQQADSSTTSHLRNFIPD